MTQDEFIEAFQQMRLIDDFYMRYFFVDQKECIELILRVILDRDDVDVLSFQLQKDSEIPTCRSVCYDIVVQDHAGARYNIEFQNASDGASPLRARYHAGLLDAGALGSGADFKELPPTYVIFITAHDVLGGDKAIYHIERRIDEMAGKSFGDESYVIYVNGAKRDETALGKLMQDFFARDAGSMHYQVLKDRTNAIKDITGEGKMCEFYDKLRHDFEVEFKAIGREEGRENNRNENALTMLEDGILPLEKIALYTGLTLDQVKALQVNKVA